MKRNRLRMDRAFVTGRRQFLAAGGALLASGCFASFGATNALYEWNKGISDSKWLQWLLFLGLVIIPVYGLFILGDVLIFNTIEFFSGSNPIGGSIQTDLGKGRALKTMKTEDPALVRHELYRDGKLQQVFFVRRVNDGEMQLLDENRQVISRARRVGEGDIELLDAEGRLIKRVTREQADRITGSIESGRPVCASIEDAIGASAREIQLAANPGSSAAF